MKPSMVRTTFETFNAGQVPEYSPADANGVPYVSLKGGSAVSTSTTGARTSVTADGGVQDVAANATRAGLIFKNTSDVTVYITYASSGTPSATDHDIALEAGDLWVEPAWPTGVYAGAYRVISASAAGSGSLRVVQF